MITTHTVTGNIADLLGDTYAEASAILEQQEAMAGLTGEDEAVALLVGTPSSDTASAPSASFGRITSTDGTVLTGLGALPEPTGVGVELVFTADGLEDIRINGESA